MDTGFLDVGSGHRLWWRCLGNPRGLPTLVLHGGPGSGTSQWYERWFDLDVHHVVLIDQRNSGRSTPHASSPHVDLTTNTTFHLIEDLERLRTAMGVEAWLLTGASWGTTLALAYAQRHPAVVAGMILVSTVTTSAREVDWITRGMSEYFPAQWREFISALPIEEQHGNIAKAYNRILMDPDPSVHGPAAAAWCDWESTHVSTDGRPLIDPRFSDKRFRLAFSRIVTHYWAHHAFLPDGDILARMPALAGVPATMIHGRQDLSSPLHVAEAIHRAWPGSRLTVVDDVGHGVTLESIRAAVADVTAQSHN